ncbi:MAG: cobalamin biosynthesis protein [Thaumarchaeota archaeon]|nr:cobalamin biosynthesis protein [Nitrososphaerota archaeon]MBI3642329.1 cobalamin biosynthesis protein [Nitrososphaerota archaeon]
MIIIPVLAVLFALSIDFAFGDPRNKFHPTVWVGTLIGKLVPFVKNNNPTTEKIGGLILTISVTSLVASILYFLNVILHYLDQFDFNFMLRVVTLIFSIVVTGYLLKTTIAIKGMEKHATLIMQALSHYNLDDARAKLSMIVKRDTKNLDRQHIISGTLESISENTVDGIIGPLFYFAIFGLSGAFIYRTINTIDSMIGYKTSLFRNLGWFGANCDKILNFLPSRITSLVMLLAIMILRENWRHSLEIMRRDGKKTESPNAGYPMATLAGALSVKFEKIDHYVLGDGNLEFTEDHFKSAISIMKLTTILFCAIFTIPMIVVLSYLGWWIHV